MCAKCNLDPDDRVAPLCRPLGNFRPVFCCLCGVSPNKSLHQFFEGPVCSDCWFSLSKLARVDFNEWTQERGAGK